MTLNFDWTEQDQSGVEISRLEALQAERLDSNLISVETKTINSADLTWTLTSLEDNDTIKFTATFTSDFPSFTVDDVVLVDTNNEEVSNSVVAIVIDGRVVTIKILDSGTLSSSDPVTVKITTCESNSRRKIKLYTLKLWNTVDNSYNGVSPGGSVHLQAKITNSGYTESNLSTAVEVIIETPNTISFTINSSDYTSVENMTWAEWVRSNYSSQEDQSTKQWIVDDQGYIQDSTTNYYVAFEGNHVKSYDTIIAGGSYDLIDTMPSN